MIADRNALFDGCRLLVSENSALFPEDFWVGIQNLISLGCASEPLTIGSEDEQKDAEHRSLDRLHEDFRRRQNLSLTPER